MGDLVDSKMSAETDVHTLFQVYASLQDIMKQHDLIDLTLKDLSTCEDTQDYATLENAAASKLKTNSNLKRVSVAVKDK